MTPLEKSSSRAQKRLWLNRWLSALGWCMTGAAGAFCTMVILQRLLLPVAETGPFFGIAVSALLALACVAASVWTVWTRETLPVAAARLDQAARLKERLSSALHCQSSDDPFARAVVVDAEQVSQKVVVPIYLPIRAPRSANYAGVSAALALLVFALFPAIDLAGKKAEALHTRDTAERVERAKAVIQPHVQQQMNQLAEQNPALKQDIEDWLPQREEPLRTPFDVRREEMKRIESLKEKWESRRSRGELASVQEFKNMARRLAARRQQSKTPVDELRKALSAGDLKAAQKALDALKEELSKAADTPEEKQGVEEIKRQLEALSKQLQEMADEDRKIQDALAKAGLSEEEIAQALERIKKGDTEAVVRQLQDKGLSERRARELSQLARSRCAACAMANNLGMCFGQAASGMGQAGSSALEGLIAAGEQLSQLEAMEQELYQLARGLADLDALKNDLGRPCSECGGSGMCDGQSCGACAGSGMCRRPGEGYGTGIGKHTALPGSDPREPSDYEVKYERAPTRIGPGRIISQQWIDGEQLKDEPTGEFVEANIAARREAADAVDRERIPRHYHGALREYFRHSAEELPADTDAAETP